MSVNGCDPARVVCINVCGWLRMWCALRDEESMEWS